MSTSTVIGASLFAGWLVGCVILALSYWRAGPIWIERHSLKFKVAGRQARCSGAIGEMAILGYCAALLWIVDSMTPTWSFIDIIARRPYAALAALAFVSAIVAFHTVRAAEHPDPATKKRLRQTYAIYAVYSALLFAGGMILIYTIVTQFWFDTASFMRDGDQILERVRAAAAGGEPRPAYEAIEFGFVDAMQLLKRAEDQMSPVFIFAIAIFVINLLILYTPLRGLFLTDAVFLTNVGTLVAIVAVGAAGAIVYVFSYSAFLDDFLHLLTGLPRSLIAADLLYVRRYGEIVLALDQQRSLVGFITKMSNEWGGLTAVVGIVQAAASQLARKPEIAAGLGTIVMAPANDEAGDKTHDAAQG